MKQFTAIFRKSGSWYTAWVEELPGVNTQGKTLAEAKENLLDALELTLTTNKEFSTEEAGKDFIREQISVRA